MKRIVFLFVVIGVLVIFLPSGVLASPSGASNSGYVNVSISPDKKRKSKRAVKKTVKVKKSKAALAAERRAAAERKRLEIARQKAAAEYRRQKIAFEAGLKTETKSNISNDTTVNVQDAKIREAAVKALGTDLDPPDDIQETGAVKTHLAGVLLRRVAAQLTGPRA